MQTEVIDKEGRIMGRFKHQDAAVKWAMENLPGEQDTGDDPVPNGWDLVVCGDDAP